MRRRLWVLGGLVAGYCLVATPAVADEVVISDEARHQFTIGVQLLEDPEGARYEEAYLAFKKAYASSPSPRILNNLGLTAMKLERDSEAIWALSEFIAKVPEVDAALRQQVETDLATLKAGVVTLNVTVEPPGALVEDVRMPVQGQPVRNVYGPLREPLVTGIRRGHHVITVKLSGYREQRWEIDAEGEAMSRQFTLEKVIITRPEALDPPKPAPAPAVVMVRPVPPSVYAGLATTGALAIATGVVGGLAVAKADDYDSANSGAEPMVAEELRDEAQRLNIAGDVLLGTAVVAAGVTAVLFLTRAEVPADTARRVKPFALPGQAGVSVAF